MVTIHFQCMEKSSLDILPSIFFCVPHKATGFKSVMKCFILG